MLTALGLGSVAAVAGCSSSDKPKGGGPSASPASGKAKVAISAPAADATDVPASAEIVYSVTDAASTVVTLTDSKGANVPGALHPDGAGWMPDKALDYGASYTAKVVATDDQGKNTTVTSAFTVMAKPANVVSFVSFSPDDAVVGIGMPLIFRLSRKIPKEAKAAVQRRILVQTDPVQEGIWTWFTDDELHWRPKEFWKANTKINVNVRVGGVPCGGDFYGKRDSTLRLSIGPNFLMLVDDVSKKMKVMLDDAVVREIPVSLGRPSMPSSSGTMVIIEKFPQTVFDTMTDPNPANRYRTEIQFAQRLTFGGEFIHAAPWSVGDQGVRDVSHGCVNMSTENAQWLYDQTLLGSPVIIGQTGRSLVYGNGWTDFDLPWDQYVRKSAIPYKP